MFVAAPFGFYGSGNIGDEATLQGFARLVHDFKRPLKVVVASQDPVHTKRVEPSFQYHQYHGHIGKTWPRLAAHLANAYIFPGGTPIAEALGDWPLSALAPMVEHGHSWGKPSVFVGVGMEKLTRQDLRDIMRQRVVPFVAHWSVRSERDRERLLDLGAQSDKVTVAADMAWLLPPADSAFGKRMLEAQLADGRPLIGVNVNAEEVVMARAPQVLEHLAATLDMLVEQNNAKVLFLFNEIRDEPTFDIAAANMVKAQMRHPEATCVATRAYLSPPQMMSLISCCSMTISTRYHFCLFSALQGVPFLAITRSDKVADLCNDLRWDHCVAPEKSDPPTLAKHARKLLADPAEAIAPLKERVAAMKVRAEKNFAALEVLYAQRSRRSDWARRAWSRIFKIA